MTKSVAEIAKQITGNAGGNGKGTPAKTTPQAEVPSSEPVIPKPEPLPIAPEPKREMTITEKILKVENLQLVIEKRQKLVETLNLLERFKITSNDFNCSLRLSDSDGNVFTTAFTPGIKRVIEFLKTAFEMSIAETEENINF